MAVSASSTNGSGRGPETGSRRSMAVSATGQASDPREPTISLIELAAITIRLTHAISTNAGQHSRDLPGRIFRRDHAAYQAGFQTLEWDESDFSRVKPGSTWHVADTAPAGNSHNGLVENIPAGQREISPQTVKIADFDARTR
ncbi:hypothetical protein E3T43_06610 [Cryobacterium sp. Hh7]|uniref:hypothetical protein n=1 Tax=Cryobacterium sp. Hh7 TaxID=1259159 RepID=UPI00106A6252|nr:hypothetical protein [Cryobacterium sp. Hh7]TFD58610.1 hypothetical protein E3T43_06610 [Cryobacterium sp. Hh7]